MKTDNEKLVNAIMSNNSKANKLLEKILKKKVADKISEVFKTNKKNK